EETSDGAALELARQKVKLEEQIRQETERVEWLQANLVRLSSGLASTKSHLALSQSRIAGWESELLRIDELLRAAEARDGIDPGPVKAPESSGTGDGGSAAVVPTPPRPADRPASEPPVGEVP